MDMTTNPITIPRIIGRIEELDELGEEDDELAPVPLPAPAPVPVPVPVPVPLPVPGPVGIVGVLPPPNIPPLVSMDTEVVLLVN